MFRPYRSYLHLRAVRSLLLTLPLLGFSQFALVQAQPVPTIPDKKGTNSFSPELKASIGNLLAFSTENRVCKRLVNLHVENATLGGVIARLRQILPTGSLHLEVRGDTPIKVSLDLKQVSVGDALSDLARLAGCRLYVLPDTLLIVPEAKLSPGELRAIGYSTYNGVGYFSNDGDGTEWLRAGGSVASGGKAIQLFTRAIAQEVTGQDTTTNTVRGLTPGVTQTRFGALSPDSQAMLKDIANFINDGKQGYVSKIGLQFFPISLNADSLVRINISSPGQINISFPVSPLDPSTSNAKAAHRGFGMIWSPQ